MTTLKLEQLRSYFVMAEEYCIRRHKCAGSKQLAIKLYAVRTEGREYFVARYEVCVDGEIILSASDIQPVLDEYNKINLCTYYAENAAKIEAIRKANKQAKQNKAMLNRWYHEAYNSDGDDY